MARGPAALDPLEQQLGPKCPERLGRLLERKEIPSHLAVWGEDADHKYEWWSRQAFHYLRQLV